MGCDIHSHLERYNPESGQWRRVTGLFPCEDYFTRTYGNRYKGSPFDWRCYTMYAFLADVRNDYDCRIEPLDEPRDIPEDVTWQVAEDVSAYGSDGHSHSWLLLSELLAADYEVEYREGERLLTLRQLLSPAFFRDMELMRLVAPDPQHVRLVFYFDN